MAIALILLRGNEPNYRDDMPRCAGTQTMWRIVEAILKTTYAEQLSYLDQSLVRQQCHQNKVANRIACLAVVIAAISLIFTIAAFAKAWF